MCQNCKLCKDNVVTDNEIESKIKRTLVNNITKEYKDESMKNKDHVNIISTIDRVSTDTAN
jgi:hypothetical protein